MRISWKLSDDTAEQIRDLIKAEGNTKDAYEQAKNLGLEVSKRQVISFKLFDFKKSNVFSVS